MSGGTKAVKADCQSRVSFAARRGNGGGFACCLLLALGCIALEGCGRPMPRLAPPAIDPAAAGQAAIDEYDTNHDGVISGAELDRCPALKAAEKKYDHGSGKITADDIAERIRAWQASRVCMSQMAIRITLDGKPLKGATVTSEPEKFLGPNIPGAKGVTNAQGTVWPQVDRSRPGMFYGLYKLRVSKTIDGQETIPARYNTETELGFEKAPDSGGLAGMKLALKSK
jgi:hypothetical protein